MEVENKINQLFINKDVDIYIKKVDQFDARVIFSYKDKVELFYIGVHEIFNFMMNGFVFKTNDILSDIRKDLNINEKNAKDFDFRLAGRVITLLNQDPVIKVRRDIEKNGL